MKRWIAGVTGALVAGLAWTPAFAQDRSPEQDVVEAAALLIEKLGALSEGLGIDAPVLPQEAFTAAFGNALPILPVDDPGLSWSSGFAFDFKTSRTTGDLEPDEEGRTVFTDARACVEPGEVAEVVHFQRFTRGDVRGHRCVISFGDPGGESVWVLQSHTFAEGPQRRLRAYYGVATAIDGDRDRARRVLEGRLDQNVALAGVMADYALEMFLTREATAERLTLETLPDRLARLQERLVEAGESFEAQGRTTAGD